MSDRITGKQQSFAFSGSAIPITKCSPKITRKLADTTDSGDYVTSPDMIFPTQIPVSCPLELAIEGRFRFSSTPGLIAAAATSLTNIPAAVNVTPGSELFHGNFDLSDFSYDGPYDDTVTYTATLKSNGQWTPG
jgi:hypothetical protein